MTDKNYNQRQKRIETFLSNLENSEKIAFKEKEDYLVINFMPFETLIYIRNIVEIIDLFQLIERKLHGLLIREHGNLSLAISEEFYNNENIKSLLYLLFNKIKI